MNDKVWKTIQISSFSLLSIIGIVGIFSVPREKLPDGGWELTFPSLTYQITLVVLIAVLGLIWVFATYVRKEGEISIRAAKRGLVFIVGIGIFYLLLQVINP